MVTLGGLAPIGCPQIGPRTNEDVILGRLADQSS